MKSIPKPRIKSRKQRVKANAPFFRKRSQEKQSGKEKEPDRRRAFLKIEAQICSKNKATISQRIRASKND
jgi:hypothetical protein